jgi:hypothetical protein
LAPVGCLSRVARPVDHRSAVARSKRPALPGARATGSIASDRAVDGLMAVMTSSAFDQAPFEGKAQPVLAETMVLEAESNG